MMQLLLLLLPQKQVTIDSIHLLKYLLLLQVNLPLNHSKEMLVMCVPMDEVLMKVDAEDR